MNLFEIASQKKYRYPYKGMITTEDLWDLNQSQLDTIYKALNKDAALNQEDSLLQNSSVDSDTATKIEIVKYIFRVKEEQALAHKLEAANTMKKQRIMEIIAQKDDAALHEMSRDELLAMLND